MSDVHNALHTWLARAYGLRLERVIGSFHVSDEVLSRPASDNPLSWWLQFGNEALAEIKCCPNGMDLCLGEKEPLPFDMAEHGQVIIVDLGATEPWASSPLKNTS